MKILLSKFCTSTILLGFLLFWHICNMQILAERVPRTKVPTFKAAKNVIKLRIGDPQTNEKQVFFQEQTPTNMRFAQWRCAQVMPHASDRLKDLWKRNKYPNNTITHCYVKCLLTRMGLIDLHSRGINANKLLSHWRKFKIKTKRNCRKILLKVPPNNGRCYGYYTRWRELLHSDCSTLLSFWSFKVNPKILFKPPNQTALTFCANEGSQKLKNQEQYHAPDKNLRKHAPQHLPLFLIHLLECIFRQFHYFDAYGRLDPTEIQHSYVEAHAATPVNIAAIRYCSHRANMKYVLGYWNMAVELAECMLEQSPEFTSVFYERNKLTSHW